MDRAILGEKWVGWRQKIGETDIIRFHCLHDEFSKINILMTKVSHITVKSM